jgi:hypothetical protein
LKNGSGRRKVDAKIVRVDLDDFGEKGVSRINLTGRLAEAKRLDPVFHGYLVVESSKC